MQKSRAIEVNVSKKDHQQDLKGLISFCEEEHPKAKLIAV